MVMDECAKLDNTDKGSVTRNPSGVPEHRSSFISRTCSTVNVRLLSLKTTHCQNRDYPAGTATSTYPEVYSTYILEALFQSWFTVAR